MNKDVIKKFVWWVECLCWVPITCYGMVYKNRSYKHAIRLDQPTIEIIIDRYN